MGITVQFKVAGETVFGEDLESTMAIRDVKKIAAMQCNVEPEHMRFIYNDTVLKEDDTLECYDDESDEPLRIFFTAGHTSLVGGGGCQMRSGSSTGQPGGLLRGQKTHNPFQMPVRGASGGKGLIRKYNIMMKRQEFREKAEEIGFCKYR